MARGEDAFLRSLRYLRRGAVPNRNRNFDRFEGIQGKRLLRAYKTLRSLERELDRHRGGDIRWKWVDREGEPLVEIRCYNPHLRCLDSTYLIEEEFRYLLDKYPWLHDRVSDKV